MELVTVTHKEGLAYDIRVGRHHITCDMAPEEGGKGAGLTPVELFAGSLGACIAMAVQGYCEECSKAHGDVVVDVELPDGVPEDRRDAIRRVVEQCVIHETLRHPPEVDVEILMERELRQEPALVGAGVPDFRRS